VEKFPRFAWDRFSKRDWLESGGRVLEKGEYVHYKRKEGKGTEAELHQGRRVIASQ
jgi:hypothetical protein